MVLQYMTAEERRRAQDEFGVAMDPAWFAITPRFRASSHVVVLVLAEATGRPALAIKIARLPGDGTSLDREAVSLREIQASRPGGFASIPRVIGYGRRRRHPVLVESALHGVPMSPAFVRDHQQRCCERTLAWLIELQTSTRPHQDGGWYERWIDGPLDRLSAALGPTGEDQRLIAATRAQTAVLRTLPVPLVCEHGDLSHPNLLSTPDDGIAVLDWETAERAGLPGCDLFFFLTYVAFARRRWWWRESHTSAFDRAFFGPAAWARPYVERYGAALELPPAALVPLFVATWPRYLASLVDRLGEGRADGRMEGGTGGWLRSNRFYALWRRAIERSADVCWARRGVR